MKITKLCSVTGLSLLSVLLSACSTSDEGELMRSNSKKQEIQEMAQGEPHLIHVDLVERLVTLRNGSKLDGFLFTIDQQGEQSGILKTLPLRSANSLLTADVLEGRPKINDRIRQANEEEHASLSEIYGGETIETL